MVDGVYRLADSLPEHVDTVNIMHPACIPDRRPPPGKYRLSRSPIPRK
jgi:hypothetical protein